MIKTNRVWQLSQLGRWSLLLLVWMGVIFFFSHQPGSGRNIEPPLWYVLERKSAHVFEYAVLMGLATYFFRSLFPKDKHTRILLIAFIFTLSYGCIDEIHQAFIFGRGARMSDVLIDGGGALLMTTLFLLRPHWLKWPRI